MTEQDKKDQASGKVVFSYDDGASQIEVSQVQSVNWNKDGIQYDLLQIDGKLSAGELADMAREVIKDVYKRQTPFFMSNYTFTAFARNDGAPSIAMIGSISGSIFNIIFDYIFMFPVGLGFSGAGLATAICPI